MGRNYQGVYGNWSGKTGNVVGHISQGRTIMSIYRNAIHNPRTERQQEQRLKMTLLAQLSAKLNPWLKKTFRMLDGYATGNPRSAFIGYQFRQLPSVFSGTYPNTTIEYANIQVACGNQITLPDGIAAEASEGAIGVTWTDNSNEDWVKATDRAMLLVYNPDKRRAVATDDGTQRSTRRITRSYPNSWEGDTLHAWLVMSDADSMEFSNSYYLGNFEG